MNLHRRLSGTTLFSAPVFAFCLAMLPGLSPSAKADTFQYDFTAPNVGANGVSGTANVVFTITDSTLPTSGDIMSFASSTFFPGGTVTEFSWNSASGGSCPAGSNDLGFTGLACVAVLVLPTGGSISSGFGFSFPVGSFLSPGSYTALGGSTLVITDLSTVGTPEPSSLLLLGCGLFGLPIVATFGARFGSRVRYLVR